MRSGDPAALSLYGMLYLRTAVAAARHQDRSTTTELLAHAGRAADQLGVDANYWLPGFGPSNVELHRVSAALDLGDIRQVIESAPRIDVDHLPVERSGGVEGDGMVYPSTRLKLPPFAIGSARWMK